MNNQPTTAVRRRPTKPVRKAPVTWNATKSFNTETALQILSEFVKETRKEIKKNEQLLINASADEAMCHLHFVADGFELSFILTERSES